MGNEVLLVDDEPALVAALTPTLEAAGFAVTVVSDGSSAVTAVLTAAYDLVLLDLGLPDMDGKQAIHKIRLSSNLPIIVISARHQENEKIAALDAGADDYVDKPFEIGELLARVRAAIRRSQSISSRQSVLSYENLSINLVDREIMFMGERVNTSPKEFALIRELSNNVGRVTTHKSLLAKVWGSENADMQYLRIYISTLRQKIEVDPSNPRIIITEPGVGYRMSMPDGV
jgi:two-component system KDP operon response regulator KdpE